MKAFLHAAFTRAPLPMLALAAAWGVFKFNALFVPFWVAVISAAAFELTYIALSMIVTQDRRRATIIAMSAVTVSVIYNSLAGLFAIRPGILLDRPLWADILLAVLHGAPLAVVAYNVSVLLLHSDADSMEAVARRDEALADMTQRLAASDAAVTQAQHTAQLADARAAQAEAEADRLRHEAAQRGEEAVQVGERRFTGRELAAMLDMPEATLRRRLARVSAAD